MSLNTGASWSAQNFRMEGETTSGPAAFRGFCLLNRRFTSLTETERCGRSEGVGHGGGEGGGGGKDGERERERGGGGAEGADCCSNRQ